MQDYLQSNLQVKLNNVLKGKVKYLQGIGSYLRCQRMSDEVQMETSVNRR